jgi:hypothetical protein
MNTRMEFLEVVFDRLGQRAARLDRELHASFRIELENYARHEIVRDLDPKDLGIVIEGIGVNAIDKAIHESRSTRTAATPELIGGGAIRTIISELCTDPFSTCAEVAHFLLTRAGRLGVASRIRNEIDIRHGEPT